LELIVKNAFLFPGQGSQIVGMGQDIYNADERVRDLYQRAHEILKFDLADLCFNGPQEKLNQTHYTQPALFVHSMALSMLVADHSLSAAAVAGHSLGEYSALTAAGAFRFDDALRLVKKRGELMYEAGVQAKGSMAAIIGLDFQQVERLCDRIREQEGEIVQVANVNSPAQTVISGSVAGVAAAMQAAKDQKAKRVVPLPVSGAFHSPLMQPAADQFSEIVLTTAIQKPHIPVYSNVSAQPSQKPEVLADLLNRQMTSPVLWSQTIKKMIDDGVEAFYEIGAGSVLSGLVKRIDRSLPCYTINGLSNLSELK
jgi:[acyl-carrier-protein] S-malonyltransferase